MQKAGYKIIGLADIGGGLYNEKGFDVPKAIDWVYTQKKPLQISPRGNKNDGARCSLSTCEIAIPAAIENQITEKNASSAGQDSLRGANGHTWQADAIIDAKGIFTVPDISQRRGVTVSYFEWVQDRQGFFWRESEVNERLFDVMDNAFDEVVRFAEMHKVNNRIAAYMLAIDRVASASSSAEIYASFWEATCISFFSATAVLMGTGMKSIRNSATDCGWDQFKLKGLDNYSARKESAVAPTHFCQAMRKAKSSTAARSALPDDGCTSADTLSPAKEIFPCGWTTSGSYHPLLHE